MKLELIGHEDRYAVEQLQMSLFAEDCSESDFAVSRLSQGDVWLSAITVICRGGKRTRAVRRAKASALDVRLRRQLLQQSYYQAALPHLTQAPPWGALAGVRPTKLTTRFLLEGCSVREAQKRMQKQYYVNPERSALAVQCSRATVRAMQKAEVGDVSLYVGIPFCPTRCAYCSFVSRTVGRSAQLLEAYLNALFREITLVGKLLETSAHRVRTLYIGGGTPTTLSASQLDRLLCHIRDSIDLSACLEFTVEGGRPDTLDPQKLEILHARGADRISINPQTMCDAVLKACGRPHSAGDVLQSFRQAVDAGFSAINMDLIAGLPRDSFDGFRYSLDTVAALSPANITVHTLALKKGADLFERRGDLPDGQAVSEMVAYANRTLTGLGYDPYYLYRQKYMSGSFENVGWSRDGLDCLYNIYMMEEVHTILSVGGGGMNKLKCPDGTLKRFHNPKFPEQYIAQLDSVLAQKQALFAQMKGSI